MENIRERKNVRDEGKEREIPILNLKRAQPEQKFEPDWKRFLILPFLAVLVILTYEYFYPSSLNINFFRYGHPTDPKWKENNLLANADFIETKMKGPEAIAFSPDGFLYTGLSNGVIIRIERDGHVEKIAQLGEEMDERVCDNLRSGHLAEPSCGRPFGLRFKPNTQLLYIADSFYGLFKLDVTTKEKTLILSVNDTRFGEKPLKLIEDLDMDDEGNIYFVDSSYKHNLNEAMKDVMSLFPSGRLFRYNEIRDELTLLLDDLHFPNGVQLMPGKESLLISEFPMARITKFYLSGEKKGQKETFVELPGLSDAIRLTEHRTVLVPFLAVFPVTPSLFNYLSKLSIFRSFVGYFLSHEKIYDLLPKYGLVAEFDLNGKILKTWHDKSGKIVDHVSNAVLFKDKLFLGSFTNDHITVVDY